MYLPQRRDLKKEFGPASGRVPDETRASLPAVEQISADTDIRAFRRCMSCTFQSED